jgi:hypothetical protein
MLFRVIWATRRGVVIPSMTENELLQVIEQVAKGRPPVARNFLVMVKGLQLL